jgi:hypothetical protein
MNWTDFPQACLLYFELMGVAFVVPFGLGCVTLKAVTKQKRIILPRRIGHFGIFLLLFLVFGALANGFWSCLIYGRLYHSTRLLFDFMPFWPITWIQEGTPWGDGQGELYAPIGKLWLVWALFAAVTWGATILLYRAVLKR